MEIELTKQDILELFAEQSKQLKKQSDEFHQRLLEGDKRLERSQTDFDKKLGQLAGTWGKFVAEMVKPKIVELFKEKGIQIETTIQSVEGFKDGQKYYEIDLLLINSNVAVVVEVKSSLSIDDVNEHLERIEKIRKVSPKRIDLSGNIGIIFQVLLLLYYLLVMDTVYPLHQGAI